MEYALHGKYKIIKYLLTITQSTKLGEGDKNKAETYSTEFGSNSNITAFILHTTEPCMNHDTKPPFDIFSLSS
jgi:hypothetical protein